MKDNYNVNFQNSTKLEDLETSTSRVKRIIDLTGRKRRIYSTIHKDAKQSGRRFRANDRERRRMNSLNGALQSLKTCVPLYHGKKRLTKLQILQFACNYINDLSDILCSPEPMEGGQMQHDNRFHSISDLLMTYMNSETTCREPIENYTVPNYDINGLNMTQRLDYLNYYNNNATSNCQVMPMQSVAAFYPVSAVTSPIDNVMPCYY